jgi:hypothetical protein
MISDCKDSRDNRDSKIGNKIRQSILEKELNCLKNPEDYKQIQTGNKDRPNVKEIMTYKDSCDVEKNEIIKYDVKMNLQFNYESEEELRTVKIKITNLVTINDLLKESINSFNNLFYKDKIALKLNTDLKSYVIKPSKKNGKVDSDLPRKNFLNKFRN